MKKVMLILLSAVCLIACKSNVDAELQRLNKAIESRNQSKIENTWKKLLPVYQNAGKGESEEKHMRNFGDGRDNETAYKIWKHTINNHGCYIDFGLWDILGTADDFCFDTKKYILEQAYLSDDFEQISSAHSLFNPNTLEDWDEVDWGDEILSEYVELTRKYDKDWEEWFMYQDDIPEYVIRFFAEEYPDTKFGRRYAKILRQAQRSQQQAQEMASLSNLIGNSSTSSSNKMHYYQCAHCGLLLKSDRKPSPAQGVCKYRQNGKTYTGNHSFAELCTEGRYLYTCTRCGLQVTADHTPDQYNNVCNGGRHSWNRSY